MIIAAYLARMRRMSGPASEERPYVLVALRSVQHHTGAGRARPGEGSVELHRLRGATC
jgi:hypothetical protein